MMAKPISYCARFALLALLVAPFLAWAQVLTDPTRPPDGIDGSSTTSSQAAYPQVKGLQSLIISPGHCAAIIDGKTVLMGGKHGAEKLVEITERGVVLEGERGRRSLTLFAAVEMKITGALAVEKQGVKCDVWQSKRAENPGKKTGTKEMK